MSVRCIRCGTPIQGTAQFCEECAALNAEEEAVHLRSLLPQQPQQQAPFTEPMRRIQPQMHGVPSRCPTCGSELAQGVTFCPSCGQRVAPEARLPNYDIVGRRILAGLIDLLIIGLVLVFLSWLSERHLRKATGTAGGQTSTFRLHRSCFSW